ncbi:MAG: tol-pal system protein YbgF [Cycloclasticus sp.]|nr:tol-pal system protein YbgF [Cycloclasticus sp.]MBQ0789325.1 tol-pal system protein YbgF [Cycloclasticus sp.]
MIARKITGQFVAIVLLSGAASAALPPVVDGTGQVTSSAVAAPAAPASSMMGLYNRLEQLQNEVQQLRGQVEEQTYLIDNLKKRQRDLYLDTDRRLQELETGRPISSSSAPPSPLSATNNQVVQSKRPASPAGGQDKQAYEAAFSSLKSGQYQQAINHFTQFASDYPTSSYLPNALYWLGEASYVNRDFKRAEHEFNQVLVQFPSHSKAKDAMLKIGFIQHENKQVKQAQQTLTNVVKSYPGTTVARLAEQRLEKMRLEKP